MIRLCSPDSLLAASAWVRRASASSVQPKDQPLADPLYGLISRVKEYSGYTRDIATSDEPLHTELTEEAGAETMGDYS